MRMFKRCATTLAALTLCSAALVPNALAAPSSLPPLPSTQAAPTKTGATQKPIARAHAWVHLDVPRQKSYVGQAIPVTVTAFFRDVESVTLEGGVKLDTKAIVTSELSREPVQSTTILNGEPTLVATWKGTVTPSSAGPLDLAIDVPVRIRYRDAAPRAVVREMPVSEGDDPFADMGGDPFDPNFMNRMQQRMMHMQQMFDEPASREHEEVLDLKASAPALDAMALPTAGQPVTYSGAVGNFTLSASVSSARANVSDPITLRIVATGAGDLDRVDLPGLRTSDSWKTYPPKATREPKTKTQPERKVFEQVIIPLRGGDMTIPAIALSSFDPITGRYVETETAPLSIRVDGTAAPIASTPAPAAAPLSSAAEVAPPITDSPSKQAARAFVSLFRPWMAEAFGALALAALLFALAGKLIARSRSERSLRRHMKRAAAAGKVAAFFDDAHRLIELRLGKRWGVAPSEITSEQIRQRLGPSGDTLAEVLTTHDALRFARANMAETDLKAVCTSVEASLRACA